LWLGFELTADGMRARPVRRRETKKMKNPIPSRPWVVVCDFDGTITFEDVTDKLLERHAHASWRVVEEQWLRGEIGSRDCLSRQIELIDASAEEIDAVARSIEIDPGFARFVALCGTHAIPLTIVSDGIDRMISAILGAHRLDHIACHANGLVQTGDRSFKLTAPYSNPSCLSSAANCKCDLADALVDRHAGQRLIYVGDGQSDFCAASEIADVIFAKSKLADFCRSRGIEHRPFATFDDVCMGLGPLLASQPILSGQLMESQHVAT
jgi:2-hydroxy-3-keto-5-methylthiopentenyl-1-phosphate phosphatase